MSIDLGKSRAFALIGLITGGLLLASCSDRNINLSPAAVGESLSQEGGPAAGAATNVAHEQPIPGDEETFQTYILASIPERSIYLFAEENGVTLQVGDLTRQYDWIYMTPRGIEPRLKIGDFDADGQDELAVNLYIGSGTGISVEELHIVELDDLRDYPLSVDDVRSQIDQAIDRLKARHDIPGRYADKELSFGNWIGYEIAGAGLQIVIGLGVPEQGAMPEYIGELTAEVGYKEGKYELTDFRFVEDEQAAASHGESGLAELGVNNESAESPDGKYVVEAYGVNEGIAAGGLHPAEGIRLVKASSGEELWSTTGYYSHSFVWSPNSRYAAVSYEARTWGGTIVIDARDGSEIALPDLEALRREWGAETTVNEHRSDPLFRSEEWLDDRRLRVSFEWFGADGEGYSGEYVYDVPGGKLLELRPNA
ncbi:hypothetical protein J4772_19095 [Cohnella sp. LGH]|uniref:hypothetical protein n=1 Tax=Cohnella sp. LGH TaxID=1619153 RepID=UPI001ADAD070|nr:hypothetical protein [Cohnella sp. LGH]QTH46340.1 hypothetical protein J4772_19095 [Cohnella sp. LGH]